MYTAALKIEKKGFCWKCKDITEHVESKQNKRSKEFLCQILDCLPTDVAVLINKYIYSNPTAIK
jgi:hypothetical protein